MAINTDDLKNGKGSSKAQGKSIPTDAASGNDMALALTSAVQGQSNELAIAAQAAAISIDHASDRLSDYFSEVLAGRELISATLIKTQQKIEAGGRISISTDVPMVTVDLPASNGFGEVRQQFAGLFGGGNPAHNIPSHYILSGPTETTDSDEAGDE